MSTIDCPATLQAEHDAYDRLMSTVHSTTGVMSHVAWDLRDYAGALRVVGNDALAGKLADLANLLLAQITTLDEAFGGHLHAMTIESEASTHRLFAAVLKGALDGSKFSDAQI